MSTLPTYTELYQWVCSKEENAVVGDAGMSCHCPLAEYLQETHHEVWLVRDGSAWQLYRRMETYVPLEPWLIQVIQKVDALGFMTGITASIFKHILEQVAPSIP